MRQVDRRGSWSRPRARRPGPPLADPRNQSPDLVALGPAVAMRAGDAASRQAWLLVLATIPVAVSFLCGSLAQGFPRYRSPCIVTGFVMLLAGAGLAILIELGGV